MSILGKMQYDNHNFFSQLDLKIKFEKRKKHIKKLAEKKRNKHVQVAETNINVKNNEESLWEDVHDVESDDEIMWEDYDLNNNHQDLIKILMTQMQNYIPPTRKSTYTGNSARTKRRHNAQVRKDVKGNGQTIIFFRYKI